jgi:hypothetical protein
MLYWKWLIIYDEGIDELHLSDVEDSVWKSNENVQSIRDFQCNFIYHSMRKIIEKSSDGLTTSGFES